jgi:hypothetical protein
MRLETLLLPALVGGPNAPWVLMVGTMFLVTGLVTAFKATARFRPFADHEIFWDRLLRRGAAFILFFGGLGLASGGIWLQLQAIRFFSP